MTSADSDGTSSRSSASPVQLRIIFWTGSDSLNSQLRASQLGGGSQNHCSEGSWLVESFEQGEEPAAAPAPAYQLLGGHHHHEKVPGASLFTVAPKTALDSVGVSVPHHKKSFKVLAFKEQTCKRWGRARFLHNGAQEDQPRRFN